MLTMLHLVFRDLRALPSFLFGTNSTIREIPNPVYRFALSL